MNYLEVMKSQETKFGEHARDTGLVYKDEEFFAVQQFKANPSLIQCETQSIQMAILNVALTGLSLNPSLAYAFLIPRKGKCVLDISYRGMIQIAYNAGAIKNIRVELVRQQDEFRYEAGSANTILHRPNIFSEERGDIIGVYSIATYINNEASICCMAKEEVEFVKSKSQAVKAGKDTIWRDWEGEMYKKTVLKRHFKMLPKSEKLLEAVAILNEHEGIDFEREEKPVINMPEAINTTQTTPDGQGSTPEDYGLTKDVEDENDAHSESGEESGQTTQNFEFIVKMQEYKKAMTEAVYRKMLMEVVGVEKSNQIVDPNQQADTLIAFGDFCKEKGLKVQEVGHAKK